MTRTIKKYPYKYCRVFTRLDNRLYQSFGLERVKIVYMYIYINKYI